MAKGLNWHVVVATALVTLPVMAWGQAAGAGDDQAPVARQKATGKAATGPTSRPARGLRSSRRNQGKVAIPPAAMAAVQELRGEYVAGKARTQQDYLQEKPNAELTVDVLLAVLQRRLGQNDAMDGYMKWQLVAGLPKELPAAAVDRVANAYRESPAVLERPGITQEQKQILDRELQKTRDAAGVSARLHDEVARVQEETAPTVAYRDQMFALLPDGPETFELAMQDAYQRAQAGFSPAELVAKLSERMVKWQETAPAAQVRVTLGQVEELLAVQAPAYYEQAAFNPESRLNEWDSRRVNFGEMPALREAATQMRRKLGMNERVPVIRREQTQDRPAENRGGVYGGGNRGY